MTTSAEGSTVSAEGSAVPDKERTEGSTRGSTDGSTGGSAGGSAVATVPVRPAPAPATAAPPPGTAPPRRRPWPRYALRAASLLAALGLWQLLTSLKVTLWLRFAQFQIGRAHV